MWLFIPTGYGSPRETKFGTVTWGRVCFKRSATPHHKGRGPEIFEDLLRATRYEKQQPNFFVVMQHELYD